MSVNNNVHLPSNAAASVNNKAYDVQYNWHWKHEAAVLTGAVAGAGVGAFVGAHFLGIGAVPGAVIGGAIGALIGLAIAVSHVFATRTITYLPSPASAAAKPSGHTQPGPLASATIPSPVSAQTSEKPLTINQRRQMLMKEVDVSYAPSNVTLPKNYSYDFEAELKKIEKARAEGKKICLFVGRTPLEKLPSDNEDEAKNKKDEFWVSADLFIYPQCKDPEIDPSEIENRCFLWLEFNDDRFIELISGLFDKVVIDLSTTKGLLNSFTTRFKSILRNENSELICEQFCYGMFSWEISKPQLFDKMYQIPFKDYETFQNSLREQGVDEDKITIKAAAWMDKQALTVFTEGLHENYSSVELKESAQFPYSSTMNPEKGPMDYFVLKGKKT